MSNEIRVDSGCSMAYFRRYPQLIWTLYNIHHHVKNLKYDFPIVICGKTGNGKSMLLLHIIDLWYNVILREKITPEHIKHIKNTRHDWIKNFKEMLALDINANDEATDGLMSKESVTKFGRDIQKLYNVFRKKLFITPILIPDFFDLPPYFRKRVRGLIWVDKRGRFRYYTGTGIMYLNALNENKNIKRMEVARPFFTGYFPDYTGLLRLPYDEMAMNSPDSVLDNMIKEIEVENKYDKSSDELYYDQVSNLILQGKKRNDIISELKIGAHTYTKIRKRMLINGVL